MSGKREFCCKTLEESLSGVNGQGAGLHALEVVNIKTGQRRTAGVFVRAERKRRKSDAGTMLNYCPFCRTDLEEFHKPGAKENGDADQ